MATQEMKIHRVIEGPYDLEDDDLVWCLCLAEIDGSLEDVELYFDTFDEAYSFKKHFLTSIQPIVLPTQYLEEDYQ
jgi:hypothetical protein